jgi:hypothetical protein
METKAKETYEAAKREATKALIARNAIDDCFSPEWKTAHAVARTAHMAKEAAWKAYCATKPDTDEMTPSEKFIYFYY